MKFWKHSLVAAGIFFTVATAVTYTSCNHDSCKALICRNGGTCADEFCRCPHGYEGTQCEIISRNKFLGFYEGQTQVNGEPVKRDFATVEVNDKDQSITGLRVYIATRSPEVITGRVATNGVEVDVEPVDGKKVTWKRDDAGRIEILIEEMIDDEKRITIFRGTKQ